MGSVISTSAVDAYIEKNSKRFVEELKELCTFPSISNHGQDALKPARDWLPARLLRLPRPRPSKAFAVRALRRAAGRSNRAGGLAPVGAGGAGRPHLRSRGRRRQGGRD